MSKLIAQTLPEADKLTVDPMHYYRQVLHGYYNFNCYVSEGVTRTAKFYIPEGSVYNQPTIFLAVPAARPTDTLRTKKAGPRQPETRTESRRPHRARGVVSSCPII